MQGTTRDEIQIQAIKIWINENKQGTIVLSTGFGKTKVGCIVAGEQLKKQKINSVLIVVPQIPLVEQWKEELIKWNYNTDNIEIICIQSAYKIEKEYDLLIVDEIHRTLSPEFSKLYENVKYSQILGLTATPPHKKESLELLDKIAPIVFTKTIEDAVEIGAVSEYIMYNLEVGMTRSGRAKYRTFDGMLKRAQLEIGMIKRLDKDLREISIFDIAREYAKKKEKLPLVKWSREFWNAMTMRKWTCYSNEAKIAVVKEIIEKFPERKWILFNKSIKFAELLQENINNSVVYHSKQNKIEREEILDQFKTNKIRYLIAVDALNEGVNIPDADSAICISGVSTELTQIQHLGRVGRFAKNKKALFINLFSKDTIEETWVRKKTKSLKNVRWIQNIDKIDVKETKAVPG